MEPVGLRAQAPDVLGTLSQILGIRQQQQQVRGATAQAQMSEQDAAQRQALAGHDFTRYLGPDGTFDLNLMAVDPELRQAAGDQFLDVLTRAAAQKQAQLTTRATMTALTTDQRSALNNLLSSLRGDPDVESGSDAGVQKVHGKLIEFGEMYGPDALPVLQATAQLVQSTPKERMGTLLASLQRQNMSAEGARQSLLPQYANTGSELRNINPDVSPMAPPTMPLTIAPGQQATLEVDQLGNPYILQRDRRGNIIGATGMGGGGPATFGVGERQAFEAQAQQNFENITANRRAASMAPQQLDQINKALKLASETATGTFAAKRADIESALGSILPTGFQGLDDASKLNELEKLTERIAADAAAVLGVNARTDAERESIRKQNANIGYTSQAIQNVLKYAKAQTLAMQAKGDAQEEWLKREGNSIVNQHEFETQFRQAYDPRVFQMAVMTPEERAKERAKMSADEVAELQKSIQKMRELGVTIGGR